METLLGLGAGGLLVLLLLWWLPVILIARSPRTAGLEKLVWIGLVLFFSWFSWILYLLIAPVNRQGATP